MVRNEGGIEMKITILDYETKNEITNFNVRKNMKHGTVIDKVKEKLSELYNNGNDFRMLPTGKIDLATGESDIHYICFGIKKDIKILEELI